MTWNFSTFHCADTRHCLLILFINPHTHYQYSAEYSRETLCKLLWFSVHCSPLWYCVLCPPTALVFPDSQLCLFNSEDLPGSSWVPLLPTLRLGNFIKAEYWGSHRVHLICSLSSKAHLSRLPNIQCLKKCYFIYFVWFWLRQVG